MIIRPAVKKLKGFTMIPNSVINDRSLDADARLYVLWAMSKQANWSIRPPAVAKALSREGGRKMGRTRLARIFKQVMARGYMARSEKQTHRDDGDWGPYVYFVGMPDDVAAAVAEAGIAVLAHAQNAHAQNTRARGTHAQNEPANHKEKNLLNNKTYKAPCNPPLDEQASLPLVGDEVHPGADGPNGRARNGHHGSSWQTRRDAKHVALADLREHNRRQRENRIEGQDVIHRRLAGRLGYGDVERGFLIIFGLTESHRDQLTAMERVGTLSDFEVASARAAVELRR